MALQHSFKPFEIEELFHEIINGNTEPALNLTFSIKVKDNVNQRLSSPAKRITQTCLHAACEQRNLVVAKRLLDIGANPNITDMYESTPLHNAAAKGDLEVVQLLVKNDADTQKKKAGRNALAMANMYGKSNVVAYLKQFEPCCGVCEAEHGAAGPVTTEEHMFQLSFGEMVSPEVEAVPLNVNVKTVQSDEDHASPAPKSESVPKADVPTTQLQEKVAKLEAALQELKTNQETEKMAQNRSSSKAQVLKNRIQASFEYILDNVNCGEHLDFLLSKMVLSVDDYQQVDSKIGTKSKNRALLLMLLTRPADQWVFHFLAALERHQATIDFARKLKK